MSVEVMSAIFKTEFFDLDYVKDGEAKKAKASTCKLVLLAIADHANDYGESSYPGLKKLELKTALSRQGLVDTIDALKYNGILSVDEAPSRLKTNNYSINLRSFPVLSRDMPDVISAMESSDLTSGSQVALPLVVKPLDHNHPLTIIKPSVEISSSVKGFDKSSDQSQEKVSAQAPNKKRGDLVDGYIAMSQAPGIKKEVRISNLESIIQVRLGITPTRRGWKPFLEFVDNRQQKDGQMLSTFIDWLIGQPKFDVSFWGPDRMRENWDRAFTEAFTVAKDSSGGIYV